MTQNRLLTVTLSLAFGVALNFTSAAAEKKTDFDAEQEQIDKEEAAQQADRDSGVEVTQYQKIFKGTLYLMHQASGELSPDVVGHFVTDLTDMKPRRNYQLKLAQGCEDLIETFKRFDGKPAVLQGKLRLIGPNGEAKYLIAESIIDEGPTPTVKERRSGSGL